MIRIQAEITTNRGSIGSKSMNFSLFQRVLAGYVATLTTSQMIQAIFFWQYNALGGF